MEQQTGSKLGKEYVKAVYCHTAYLTSNTGLDEAQAGIKIARKNINNLRYAVDRKQRRSKEPLDESERGE